MWLIKVVLLLALHEHIRRTQALRSDCFLRISEVHGDITKKATLENAFIELQGICKTGSASGMGLVNHKLALIKAFGRDGNFNGAQVIGLVNLQNQHLNDLGYFTVGGTNVGQTTIKWGDENVRLQALLLGAATNLFKKKDSEDVSPYAIAILEGSLSGLRLDAKGIVQLNIDPKLETTIRESLVDMVVYGSTTLADKCNFYDRICPVLGSQGKYILREFNLVANSGPTTTTPHLPVPGTSSSATHPVQSGTQGNSRQPSQAVAVSSGSSVLKLSLSRCTTSSDAYIPKTFKLAPITPNSQNDCEHGARFVMENYAAELFTSDIADESDTAKACQTDSLGKMLDKNINTAISYSNPDTHESVLLPANEQGDIDDAISAAYARMLAIRPASAATPGGSGSATCSVDKETLWTKMLQKMTAHQKGIMPVTWLKTHKNTVIDWLEYIFDETHPAKSTVRCSVCHSNVGSKNPSLSSRYMPDLAKSEGTLRSTEKNMRELLHEHLKSNWHSTLISEKKASKLEAIGKAIHTAEIISLQNLNALEKSTAYMIHTIYTEARMYLPFESHPVLMQALKLRGVDSGVHHQHAKAPPLFLRVMSEDIHKRLLNHLVTNKHPVSLILDTATDSLGHDMLVLLLQGLEADKPMVYLYRVLRMGADVSAAE